jgi:hypothetical protein
LILSPRAIPEPYCHFNASFEFNPEMRKAQSAGRGAVTARPAEPESSHRKKVFSEQFSLYYGQWRSALLKFKRKIINLTADSPNKKCRSHLAPFSAGPNSP